MYESSYPAVCSPIDIHILDLNMDADDRYRLQANKFLIVRSVIADDIIPHLFQEEIFSLDHKERVDSKTTEESKMQELLDILVKRGPRAYKVFYDTLKINYSWIVDKLDATDCIGKLQNLLLYPASHSLLAFLRISEDLKCTTIAAVVIRLCNFSKILKTT